MTTENETEQDVEAQFTLVNMLAFDMMRVDARGENKIPAMWLCTSEECRQDAIQKVVDFVNASGAAYPPVTMESLAGFVHGVVGNTLDDKLAQWREFELEMKRVREVEHNPRAFFCEQ